MDGSSRKQLQVAGLVGLGLAAGVGGYFVFKPKAPAVVPAVTPSTGGGTGTGASGATSTTGTGSPAATPPNLQIVSVSVGVVG